MQFCIFAHFMEGKDLFEAESGLTVSRIRVSDPAKAILYPLYTQECLLYDLESSEDPLPECKAIRSQTADLPRIYQGDLVVNLVTGVAAIAGKAFDGYVQTGNILKIKPHPGVDPKYLAFLFNEGPEMEDLHKLKNNTGLRVGFMKQDLMNMRILHLPPLEKQILIGEAYMNALHLNYIEKRRADNIKVSIIERLKIAKGK